jgi:lipopolysaccharide/colanic/teichoic acid biosynthesis glycosyltransferase
MGQTNANPGRWTDAVRRVYDVAFSAAGLVVASPVMAAAAVAVALEDGRPVLFRQQRIGRDGRPFEMLKFRSMRAAQAGTAITAGGDSRVTRSGRFLRKYKLDELPQLWNVLRGDMSLIGPRPEVPKFVDLSDPLWKTVLSVRPGITDLASLYYRHEEGLLAGAADPEAHYRRTILPSKLKIAAEGVKRQSLANDIRILVYTVLCSFFPGRFDEQQITKALASRSTT